MNQPLDNPSLPVGADLGSLSRFTDLQNALQRNKADIGKLVLYLQNYLQKVQNQVNTQVQSVGKPLAAGATITPTNPIHHVSGIDTLSTINAGRAFTGPLMLLSDDGFLFDDTGNISVSGEVPSGHSQQFVYDGTKWHPQANTTSAAVGPVAYHVVEVSTDYTVAADDVYIWGDAAAAVVAVTLPPVAGQNGRFIEVVNVGTMNNVNVFGNGVETINGVNMQAVVPGNDLAIVTNGSRWIIV